MAVLVEPAFQDGLEVANGVALFGVGVDQAGRQRAELTVNVQAGPLSVTNPPSGQHVVPEIDRVVQLPDGRPQITRIQAATTHPAPVLDDARLLQMFGALHRLTLAWRDARNARLSDGQKALSTVLDLEFRQVADGWPKLRDGPPLPARLVWKQVRPLARAPVLSERDIGAPVPVDVRAAAQKVMLRRCENTSVSAETLLIWTHPSANLLPFAQAPMALETTVRDLHGKMTPPLLKLDARDNALTWAQWRARQGQPVADLARELLALRRPDAERLADAWPALGACSETVVTAAPEQALRAWLDQQ